MHVVFARLSEIQMISYTTVLTIQPFAMPTISGTKNTFATIQEGRFMFVMNVRL
jgi:hypothetical protein